MRFSIHIVIGSLLLVVFVSFIAYYLMLWPFQPGLEVDDPVISEWLHQDGVVIYRQGEELINSRMYIIKGERIDDGCSWHTSSRWSDDVIIVSRELATNHSTCESLIEEGTLVSGRLHRYLPPEVLARFQLAHIGNRAPYHREGVVLKGGVGDPLHGRLTETQLEGKSSAPVVGLGRVVGAGSK